MFMFDSRTEIRSALTGKTIKSVHFTPGPPSGDAEIRTLFLNLTDGETVEIQATAFQALKIGGC